MNRKELLSAAKEQRALINAAIAITKRTGGLVRLTLGEHSYDSVKGRYQPRRRTLCQRVAGRQLRHSWSLPNDAHAIDPATGKSKKRRSA